MTSVSIKDAEKICADALAQAKQLGATASEAYFDLDHGLTVTARKGNVESLEHHQDQGLTIEVYVGHHVGSASTSDLTPDAIKETVKKAAAIAKYTGEDDCNGLADKELLATKIPDLDLFHPWGITPEDALEKVIACEQHAFDQDTRITNSEGVSLDTNQFYRYYANSLDFAAGYQSTIHSLSCMLLAEDEKLMQRDYDYTQARDANDLFDFNQVAESAVNRTIRRLRQPHPIKTCQVPVLFEPSLAKGLISCLVHAVYGSSQYRKSSFLLDQLGKQVCAPHLSIQQRPHLLKGYGSCPFDNEGVATKDLDYIVNGELKSYVMSSYSARKLKMQSTGNSGGVFNLLVNSDQQYSVDQLMKKMNTGFIVTELIGQGVNMVTGDYSRGAVGFWVENGEIQHAVEGVTIAGNLKDMLNNIVAVGDDIDRRSNVQTGSILVEKMTVAGK